MNKIYNQDKTVKLSETEIDLNKGYLKADKLSVHHEATEGKEAIYNIRREKLKNGSIQVWKNLVTPAVEAKEAYDEEIDIQVYVPYTEEEFSKRAALREIAELKTKLRETDYKAIQYAEGEIALDDYSALKAQRHAWRKRINELEATL